MRVEDCPLDGSVLPRLPACLLHGALRGTRMGNPGVGTGPAGKSQLCHRLRVEPWTSYVTSLSSASLLIKWQRSDLPLKVVNLAGAVGKALFGAVPDTHRRHHHSCIVKDRLSKPKALLAGDLRRCLPAPPPPGCHAIHPQPHLRDSSPRARARGCDLFKAISHLFSHLVATTTRGRRSGRCYYCP